MEVTGISGQSFKAINTNAVAQTLYGRRLSGKSIMKMNELTLNQIQNPYNIILKKNVFGSLRAKIKSPNGKTVFRDKEKFYAGLINSDPIKFVQGLCEKANSIYKELGAVTK